MTFFCKDWTANSCFAFIYQISLCSSTNIFMEVFFLINKKIDKQCYPPTLILANLPQTKPKPSFAITIITLLHLPYNHKFGAWVANQPIYHHWVVCKKKVWRDVLNIVFIIWGWGVSCYLLLPKSHSLFPGLYIKLLTLKRNSSYVWILVKHE